MLSELKKQKRKEIESYFRSVAHAENQKNSPNQGFDLDNLILKNEKKKFLVVCKESIGDCLYCTSLLRSLRDKYDFENWDLYVATLPQYAEIFKGNNYITKILPYHDSMEGEINMTGAGNNKGFFDGYCNLTVGTQKILNYLTNVNRLDLRY